MAGSFGGGDEEYVSGINVTPLVDVVLVLLVIFLMTAPVLYQSAIKVQLPKAKTAESQEKSPLEFTITKSGETLWNKERVDLATLGAKVAELVKKNPDQTAIISADEAASHGSVVKLMDALRQAGLVRFALNVESANPPSRNKP
jgi:biopolymer transport protein ExbD